MNKKKKVTISDKKNTLHFTAVIEILIIHSKNIQFITIFDGGCFE